MAGGRGLPAGGNGCNEQEVPTEAGIKNLTSSESASIGEGAGGGGGGFGRVAAEMYISSSGRNELVKVRFLQIPGARVPKDLGLSH